MNDIQIEDDDYEILENDDDVVSLGDESACESIWWVPVEQDSSKTISELNGNRPSETTIECLVSTAEILRPKKRIKVEEWSTITLGYIQNKSL